MTKPKLVKQVFEGRYEKGYRYLDRCGEAMLILEEVLPTETGKVWMPEDIAPTGAKLKCPDLEMSVAFDSYHLVVDQDPADATIDLSQVTSAVFSVLAARFDLKSYIRFGHRRFYMFATDSIDDAQKLSVKMSPSRDWPIQNLDGMHIAAADTTTLYERSDASQGVRISLKSTSRADAVQQVDPRLLQSARLLHSGQREALIGQLHRQAKREKDPLAGVMLDIDYYWNRPSKLDLGEFFTAAGRETDSLVHEATKAN